MIVSDADMAKMWLRLDANDLESSIDGSPALDRSESPNPQSMGLWWPILAFTKKGP